MSADDVRTGFAQAVALAERAFTIALGVRLLPRYHTVKQGECLARIARKYGFADYRIIYNHSQNAQFRRKRPNPNILYPGDRVFIPDKQGKREARGTTQIHRFERAPAQRSLNLTILGPEGQPLASRRYRLKIGGKTFEETTDAQGRISQEIPIEAEQGELTVWLSDDTEPCTWPLLVGHLDPIGYLSGVQARLSNLGYYSGPIAGEMTEDLAAALEWFQADSGLPVTGTIDAATRSKLEQLHDQ